MNSSHGSLGKQFTVPLKKKMKHEASSDAVVTGTLRFNTNEFMSLVGDWLMKGGSNKIICLNHSVKPNLKK